MNSSTICWHCRWVDVGELTPINLSTSWHCRWVGPSGKGLSANPHRPKLDTSSTLRASGSKMWSRNRSGAAPSPSSASATSGGSTRRWPPCPATRSSLRTRRRGSRDAWVGWSDGRTRRWCTRRQSVTSVIKLFSALLRNYRLNLSQNYKEICRQERKLRRKCFNNIDTSSVFKVSLRATTSDVKDSTLRCVTSSKLRYSSVTHTWPIVTCRFIRGNAL